MTNVDDLENIDEGDLAYASPIEGDDVHYIETLNEWTQWRDDLATTMFNECSSRALKHAWTKEEEAILVECLVELVFAGDGSRTMAHSPTREFNISQDDVRASRLVAHLTVGSDRVDQSERWKSSGSPGSFHQLRAMPELSRLDRLATHEASFAVWTTYTVSLR
ncbi:retrotransposon protein [Cucumis melo var. makuwa]|uniref:Retrotransposon protein n=1 Tax=Cucumis melo var. makuwa TaxID=1194695 RepID=A0A5D3CEJ9_CUCMM|nr:retrotransposon protein [Cucumis melo var. makuwa]